MLLVAGSLRIADSPTAGAIVQAGLEALAGDAFRRVVPIA